MNKVAYIIIMIGLFIGIGIIFLGGSKPKTIGTTESVQNIEIKDGVQYIIINARGGYSPKISNAKAGVPTKLIVKTNGTYDCSAALVIQSLNYRKILPQTGEEVIDLGIPKAGVPLQGVCSMGMYNFLINFT